MCRRELVLIRARVHPFPSRTRKLSSLLLTILGWRRPGKIGSANTKPLRRKSQGFCHVTESHEGCGEAQGVTEGSGCLRHHPVTGQLSSLLLTILGWRRPGKIGSANTKPLRRKSRGFCHVTESHEGCGEARESHGEFGMPAAPSRDRSAKLASAVNAHSVSRGRCRIWDHRAFQVPSVREPYITGQRRASAKGRSCEAGSSSVSD